MRYLKYIALVMVVGVVFSCKKYEPFTFTDKPSFEFADTVLSAPMGFISEGSYKNDLRIYLLGNLPSEDITIKLKYSGSAVSGTDYVMPAEIIFPKGATEVKLPLEIKKTNSTENKELIITIEQSEYNIPGVRPNSRIKIEQDMPSQWIGYSEASFHFDFYFTPCTKAKYQFFYKIFGFYDFTTVKGYDNVWGSQDFMNMLQTYKNVANQNIEKENAELAASGKEPLKDDDGSLLKF